MYVGIFFAGPAAIYNHVMSKRDPEWTFLVSFYFQMVSASTVGFGDYILDYETDLKGNGALQFLNAICLYLGLVVYIA